jgi:hypothetical protein
MGRWIRLAEEHEVDERQDQDASEQDDAQSVHDEVHGGMQYLDDVDAGEKESCMSLKQLHQSSFAARFQLRPTEFRSSWSISAALELSSSLLTMQ